MKDLVTFVMKVLELILIALQITTTICRRKQPENEDELTSSEESIENLLYYKDCKHKPKDPPTTVAPPTTAEPAQRKQPAACPCPRMCCSMCCECGGNSMDNRISMFGRAGPNDMIMGGMDGLRSMGVMGDMMTQAGMHPSPPRQPPSAAQPPFLRFKKKKKMLPNNIEMSMIPPIGARRGSGFTREHIKSLLAQDEDIKKILKNLVQVTMSKVELIDGVAVPQPLPRPARVQRRSEDNNNRDDFEEDDD